LGGRNRYRRMVKHLLDVRCGKPLGRVWDRVFVEEAGKARWERWHVESLPTSLCIPLDETGQERRYYMWDSLICGLCSLGFSIDDIRDEPTGNSFVGLVKIDTSEFTRIRPLTDLIESHRKRFSYPWDNTLASSLQDEVLWAIQTALDNSEFSSPGGLHAVDEEEMLELTGQCSRATAYRP